MKCRLDIDGNLVVEADSETEAFALKKFKNSYDDHESHISLVIKPSGAYWVADDNVINILKNGD